VQNKLFCSQDAMINGNCFRSGFGWDSEKRVCLHCGFLILGYWSVFGDLFAGKARAFDSWSQHLNFSREHSLFTIHFPTFTNEHKVGASATTKKTQHNPNFPRKRQLQLPVTKPTIFSRGNMLKARKPSTKRSISAPSIFERNNVNLKKRSWLFQQK
jgi:hypothetical protein